MKVTMKNFWFGLLSSVFAAAVVGGPAVAQQSQKPNVVFILADNVGYGDLGPHGGGELRGAPTPRARSSMLHAMGCRLVRPGTG
jgi:arylsulfatase